MTLKQIILKEAAVDGQTLRELHWNHPGRASLGEAWQVENGGVLENFRLTPLIEALADVAEAAGAWRDGEYSNQKLVISVDKLRALLGEEKK